MYEYALVLTKFSVVAFLALVLFSVHASLAVKDKIIHMRNYSMNPTAYEGASQ